jgi:hypothetical protein
MTTATIEPLSILSHPSFDNNTAQFNPQEPDTTSPPPRKLSTTSSARRKLSTTTLPLIPYPQHRHSIPSWLRDILSKMLIIPPHRRAELIEVAAKVPKEINARETRPLMEVCWIDYKHHVGPLAGTFGDDEEGDRRSVFSWRGSIGGMSAWSRESLVGLLGRRGSKAERGEGVREDQVGVSGSGSAAAERRRKSNWV